MHKNRGEHLYLELSCGNRPIQKLLELQNSDIKKHQTWTHLIHSHFGTLSNLFKSELPVIGWSGESHLNSRKQNKK